MGLVLIISVGIKLRNYHYLHTEAFGFWNEWDKSDQQKKNKDAAETSIMRDETDEFEYRIENIVSGVHFHPIIILQVDRLENLETETKYRKIERRGMAIALMNGQPGNEDSSEVYDLETEDFSADSVANERKDIKPGYKWTAATAKHDYDDEYYR